MDTKYNGWTNYATWRVNLEMVDGIDPRETFGRVSDYSELEDALKDWAEEVLFGNAQEDLLASYARAFLSDVNWTEIAHHLADEYELFTDAEDAA